MPPRCDRCPGRLSGAFAGAVAQGSGARGGTRDSAAPSCDTPDGPPADAGLVAAHQLEGELGGRLQALYAQRRGEEARAGGELWRPGEPWLPRPPNGAASEAGQAAFEIGYKLQFSQEPAVQLQALIDLGQRAVHDCPPEHFLLHRAPLDVALQLAQTGSERQVWSAALRAVHHFVRRLGAAVILVGDERYLCEDDKREAGFPKTPAFFPDARTSSPEAGQGEEAPAEGSDVLPVVPCAHHMAVSLLSILHHREKQAQTVPILRDLMPLVRDFGGAADAAGRFRQYFASASDSLSSLQPPAGLAAAAFVGADMNVIEVTAWLLDAAGGLSEVRSLMPVELTQALTSCVTSQFVAHCRPGTITNLARGLKRVDSVAVDLSESARQASQLFAASLSSVRSFAAKPVKSLTEIEKLARNMMSAVRNIHYATDTEAAQDYVDIVLLAMESASKKAYDDLSSVDIDAAGLLGPVIARLAPSPTASVRASAVRALCTGLHQSSGHRLRGAMHLLGTSDLLGRLIRLCLLDPACAGSDIPALLQKVFSERAASLCDTVCDHQAWLSSAAQDPTLGCQAAGISALCKNWRARSADPWRRVEDVLRQLFSISRQRRQEATPALVEMLSDMGISVPFDAADLSDPLQLVLESPSACWQAGAKETSGFRARGVQSLKDVFTNLGLEQSIRKSAGDQLLHLVRDEKLRSTILTDEVVACCQHEATRAVSSEAVVDPYFGSICVNLLCAAMWHESENLEPGEILGQAGSFVLPLVPLIFHPYAQLRRAVAMLMLPYLFKDGRLAVNDAGILVFRVPSVFTTAFAFPNDTMTFDGPGFGEDGPEGAEEQALQSMLEQSRILQNGTDEAISALAKPGRVMTSLSAEAASAGLRTLRALDAPSRVATLLACVEASQNHGDCMAALRELNELSVCSEPVCQALCDSGWAKSFRRVMEVSPANAQDFCVWLPLLPLLQRMLLSGYMTCAGLLCIAFRMKQAAIPIMATENMPVLKAIPEVAAELGRSFVGSGGAVLSLDAVRLGVVEGCFEVLIELLQACRARGEADVSEQVLQLFFTGDFFQYATESIIINPNANYRCRCLALDLLQKAVLCAADVMALSRSSPEERLDIRLALGQPIPFLVDHICIPPPGGNDAAREGRAMLRSSIAFIRLVMETLLPESWLPSWGGVPGTFWLSKLCRDPDRAVRECAHRIAALLVHPGSESMCEMVAKSWPDCMRHMLHTAVNSSECFAVRSSAVSFVGRAYAADVLMAPDFRGFKAMRFVEQYSFWAVLTEMASKAWVPSCVLASCLEFLTQVALADAELLSEKIFSNGLWEPMLRNIVDCFSHPALQDDGSSGAQLDSEVQLFRMMSALAQFVTALMASGTGEQREAFVSDKVLVPALLGALGLRLQRVVQELGAGANRDPSKVRQVKYYNEAVLEVTRVVNSVVCAAEKIRHNLSKEVVRALRGFCSHASGVLVAESFSLGSKLAVCGLLASIYGTQGLLAAVQEAGADYGADLCLSLHPLNSAVGIAYGRGTHPSETGSAAIAAFRNLLAHSPEAKAEARGLDVPRTAVDMCVEMHSLVMLQRLQSGKGEQPEAARSMERQKLIWNLTVLKHAAFRSSQMSEAILEAGALEMVQKILAFALSDSPVLQEVCGLLCNLAASSHTARVEMMGVRIVDSSYVFDSLLAVVRADAETHSFCAVLTALRRLPRPARAETRC